MQAVLNKGTYMRTNNIDAHDYNHAHSTSIEPISVEVLRIFKTNTNYSLYESHIVEQNQTTSVYEFKQKYSSHVAAFHSVKTVMFFKRTCHIHEYCEECIHEYDHETYALMVMIQKIRLMMKMHDVPSMHDLLAPRFIDEALKAPLT